MDDLTALSPDEIGELRKIIVVEKIRKIINLHAHLQDMRDIPAVCALYAEDAVVDWGPFGSLSGRDQIYDALANVYAGRLPYDGCHVTSNIWIETNGTDAAVSRSHLTNIYPPAESSEAGLAAQDAQPQNPVIWYGLYETDYRKIGKDWKISREVVDIVWPRRQVHENFPRTIDVTSIG